MSKWKFFLGSSILVAGLLLKIGAPLVPIAIGLLLAGVFTWKRERWTKRLY